LQLFAHTENSECFSIISVIIFDSFEVNVISENVAEMRKE